MKRLYLLRHAKASWQELDRDTAELVWPRATSSKAEAPSSACFLVLDLSVES